MTKKLILWLGISLVCFTAFVLSVRATEKETVSLTNVDGKVEATLELPGEAVEEIVALQLSFQIETGEGTIKKEDISFDFDAGFSGATVQKYNYREDTGILSIYISGKKDLYSGKGLNQAQNPEIPLGKVVVNSDKTASVKVVKNSFKTVNKAHGMYEGEVNTGDGGQTINNGNTGGDADNNNPGVGGETGTPGSSNENFNPGDGSSNENGAFGSGSSVKDSNSVQSTDKTAGNAGVVGISKKVLNADWTEGVDRIDVESDSDNFIDSEQEEDESWFSEDLLWEEGAKLWKEKTGAVDMDVWTKLFFGLFAVSASVASAIGISLAVKASGKRKKRRRRRIQAASHMARSTAGTGRRSVSLHEEQRSSQKGRSTSQADKVRRKRSAAQMEKTSGNYGQSKRHVQKVQAKKGAAKRHAQKKHTYPDQPVWKDNNKPYVRKRRKIS